MGVSILKVETYKASPSVLLFVGHHLSFSDRITMSLNHTGCDAVKRNTSTFIVDSVLGFSNFGERVDAK
jgi:hypothetical protein